MVDPLLAPKWTPWGVLQRVRRIVKEPGDLPLMLRLGCFIWTAPTDLDRQSLPALLDRLRSASRPSARDLPTAVERIARLREPWLRLPIFRDRNMCYMRALALYRFLDPGAGALRIQFGVEPGADAHDRLHGHAWVTVDGQLIEPPTPVLAGRVREIYRHPPAVDERLRVTG